MTRSTTSGRPQPRVLVLGHLGGRNFGDEAMLLGLLAHFDACTSGGVAWRLAVPGGTPSGSVQNGVEFCRQAPADLLRALWHCDAVLVAGGTTFHDQYEGRDARRHAVTMLMFVLIAALARLRGSKVFLAGIGLGPLRLRRTRWLTKAWLGLASSVMVRDPVSFDIATKLVADPARVRLGFDPAVLVRTRSAADSDAVKITVNLMNTGSYPAQHRAWAEALHGCLAQALCDLMAQDDRVTVDLLPLGHGKLDSDLLALRDLHETLQRGAGRGRVQLLAFDADPAVVLARVEGANTLVSTRYHGTVFGAIARRPTLAIAYHPKVAAFCTQMDMPRRLRIEPGDPTDSTSLLQILKELLVAPTPDGRRLMQAADAARRGLQPMSDWFASAGKVPA